MKCDGTIECAKRNGCGTEPCEPPPRCVYCNCLNGTGANELRPYGPGGADVCAGCVMDGPPERLEEASRQLEKRFDIAGDVVVIGEVGGVRSATAAERNGDEPVPDGAVILRHRQ